MTVLLFPPSESCQDAKNNNQKITREEEKGWKERKEQAKLKSWP
jgi:hypothetical protein